MTKAVGYIRVSTQGQVRDGYSLAYQRDEILRHCTRNGIELIRIYEDKGISDAKVDEDGLTVEREGLQSMLADLASVAVDCVVVLNTSRLWRSDMAKVLIQRALKRHRVDVHAIEQQTYSIYNDDPNDFLINGMLELLYDANRNVTGITNVLTGASVSYTYDSQNQLTKETTWSGNTLTYTYDKLGNRTSVTNSTTGVTTTYTYDAEGNRLTSVGSSKRQTVTTSRPEIARYPILLP